LLDQALGGCMRRILFAVDGGVAEVANARGLTLGAIKGLRFPIDERSIFALASEDSYYRGPLPVEFDRGTFYSRLGLPAPSEVLVLPIYGEERLEAALYGDGGPTGRISHPDESYLPLIGLTGLAVRMLSFRTQLCPS